MSYSVRIKQSAANDLARMPAAERRRIVHEIDRLGEQPLKGSTLKGELLGLRRVRVGNYRIVYETLHDALVVLVIRVAHRREVYRRR